MKLILITPDRINHSHYSVLKEALHYIDKLHIKLDENWETIISHLEKIIPLLNEKQRNQLSIHINDKLFANHQIYHIEEALKYLQQNFDIHKLHFSEKFYHEYGSIISPELYHQFNVSVSLHHLDFIEHHNHFAYVIYGPVFSSISKANYHPKISLQEMKHKLKHIAESIEIPVIAVGGVTLNNFTELIQAGFEGIALRGFIWESVEPLTILKSFSIQWQKLKDQL